MKQQDIDIRLIGLRELPRLSVIHHWEMVRYSGTPVEVNLTTDFSRNESSHVVRLRLGVHYTTYRGQIMRKLLDYVIEADFELIHQPADFISGNRDVILPTDLVSLMLSIGIGAVRGMIALRTSRTFLRHYPLPVYDINSLIDDIIMAGEDIYADRAFS